MSDNLKFKIRKQYRLPTWDYSENAYYFVTICTKDRKDYFGNVIKEKMYLSDIGKIVRRYWTEIPKHFNDVSLDAWIVMPNHIHGIIVIDHDYINNPELGRDITYYVPIKHIIGSRFGKITPNSLSTVIRSFKSAVSKYCYENNLGYFTWQARFYDHIVRSAESLYRIREYIKNNPFNWELDRNSPENLFKANSRKRVPLSY